MITPPSFDLLLVHTASLLTSSINAKGAYPSTTSRFGLQAQSFRNLDLLNSRARSLRSRRHFSQKSLLISGRSPHLVHRPEASRSLIPIATIFGSSNVRCLGHHLQQPCRRLADRGPGAGHALDVKPDTKANSDCFVCLSFALP